MSEKQDPNLSLERTVGKLEGVVSTLARVVERLEDTMNGKIDQEQGKAIAKEVVEDHEEKLHPQSPQKLGGITLKIGKETMGKLGLWGAAAGGGGYTIFQMIEKLLGQ